MEMVNALRLAVFKHSTSVSMMRAELRDKERAESALKEAEPKPASVVPARAPEPPAVKEVPAPKPDKAPTQPPAIKEAPAPKPDEPAARPIAVEEAPTPKLDEPVMQPPIVEEAPTSKADATPAAPTEETPVAVADAGDAGAAPAVAPLQEREEPQKPALIAPPETPAKPSGVGTETEAEAASTQTTTAEEQSPAPPPSPTAAEEEGREDEGKAAEPGAATAAEAAAEEEEKGEEEEEAKAGQEPIAVEPAEDTRAPIDRTMMVEVDDEADAAMPAEAVAEGGRRRDPTITVGIGYDDTQDEFELSDVMEEAAKRRRRRYVRWGLFVAAPAVLAVLCGTAAFLQARRVQSEVEKLIATNQYQRAADSIDSAPSWYGWLLAKEDLRERIAARWTRAVDDAIAQREWAEAAKLVTDDSPWIERLVAEDRSRCQRRLKERWWEQCEAIALKGDREMSEQTRWALLRWFPDYGPAQNPAAGPAGPPTLSAVDILELIQLRLNNAWESIDAKGDKSVADCDTALEYLGRPEVVAATDAKHVEKARQLRQQVLLLRARAKSRAEPPPWNAVRADLDAYDRVLDGKPDPDAGRAALRRLLEVLARADDPSLDFDAALGMLGACKKALELPQPNGDRWTPTAAEKARRSQAEEGLLDKLRGTIPASQSPEEAVARADKLLAYLPDDPDTLMLLADMHLKHKRFDEWAAAMERATPKLDDAGRKRAVAGVKFWKSLAGLRGVGPDANTDATRKATSELYATRRDVPPELQREFAAELLRLADAAYQEEFRDSCVKALEGILPELPDDDETKNLRQSLVSSLTKWQGQKEQRMSAAREAIAKQLMSAIDSPAQPDFVERLRLCKTAEQNGVDSPLLHLCKAECLLEQGQRPQAADVFLKHDLQQGLPVAYKPYLDYLRALTQYLEPKGLQLQEAAQCVEGAFAEAAACPPLRNKYRRDRAAKIVRDAAAALATPTDGKGIEKLLESPFATAANAQQALHWLTLASEFNGVESSSNKLSRAMAALHQPTPDKELAAKLLAELRPKLDAGSFTRKDIPALYAFASAGDRPGTAAADLVGPVLAYAELVQLAGGEKEAAGADAPPMFLYEKLVAPGLALAARLDPTKNLTPEQRRKVGTLYGAKGELIRENRYEAWSFDKKPIEVALESYERALTCDNQSAKYFAGRGWCRLDLDQVPPAEEDAKAAIKIDPKYASGHALLGNVCIAQSRSLDVVAERLARLSQAYKECSTAIDLASADRKETAYSLINRSVATVEMVSYDTTLTGAQRAERLEEARDDAQRAIAIDTVYNDFAYESLGNALEDLAWLAGKDVKKNYDAAAAAFTEALRLSNQSNARHWFGRGRTYFKAAYYGNGDKSLLDKAVDDLKESILRDPTSAKPHAWLGRVYLVKKQYPLAEASLRESFRLDKSLYSTQYYLAETLAATGRVAEADPFYADAFHRASQAGSVLRFEYLDRWAETVDPSHPAKDARLPLLDAVATKLVQSQEAPPQAKLFVGLARECRGRFEEAVVAYNEALASPAVAGDKALQYKLYLRRSFANYNRLTGTTDAAGQQRLGQSLGADLYADADKAARLAPDATAQALALVQAALGKAWFARQADRADANRAALWNAAKEDFRKAIQLAPQHENGWQWRYAFVLYWHYFEPAIDRPGADNQEAVRYLSEALRFSGLRTEDREKIGRKKTDLERGAP
jgi:uncharacterized protein (DUF2267 family)